MMRLFKYYVDQAIDATGGGDPNAPTAPKGYTVSTPQQRSDWNSFLDYAATQKGANLSDPKAQTALLTQYKKVNPNFSITAEQIPAIQYEAYQLRKGDALGKLGAKELGYIRQGLSPAYLNSDTTNVGKLYYPHFGSFGTDLEGYYNSKFNPAAAPTGAAAVPAGAVAGTPAPAAATTPAPKAMPVVAPAGGGFASQTEGLPSVYANHDTATARAKQLAATPGNEFLHGRADAIINANYVPQTDKQSFHQSSLQATKALGLDPNMFWASSAEEGATGLIPDKKGMINTDPNIDEKSDYQVSGFTNFGVDHFHDDFKELVRRGYLPKDFDYKKSSHTNEIGEKVNSGDFRTVADALKAKAAYIRMHQDDLEDWSKTNKVSLSPTAKQFFTYMSYNGGPGTAHKLIKYYRDNGLLEGDKFLMAKPPHELDKGDSYGKVLPRWQMAQLMKKEKLFQ